MWGEELEEERMWGRGVGGCEERSLKKRGSGGEELEERMWGRGV